MSTRFLTLRPVTQGEAAIMPNARQSIAGTRGQIARKAQFLEKAEKMHLVNLEYAASIADAQRIEMWNKRFAGVNPFAQAPVKIPESKPWGGLRRIRPAERMILKLLAQLAGCNQAGEGSLNRLVFLPSPRQSPTQGVSQCQTT